MSSGFDSDAVNLQSSALHEALDRLRMLGLIDGDANAASATITTLIVEAMELGERNRENLILYAIGRFQSHRSGARS